MYYNPETKEAISGDNLRERLNVSFPDGYPEVFGWYLVTETERPSTDSFHDAIEGPIVEKDGKYTQTWEIHEISGDDAEARKFALFQELREKRNALIAETDYLVLPDSDLDDPSLAAIKYYRKQLKDIPDISGAPWDGGGPKTPWPAYPKLTKTGVHNYQIPTLSFVNEDQPTPEPIAEISEMDHGDDTLQP